MRKDRILIVGGGIAGTTLAGLLQDSFQVTLIEEGSEWRTIGYAVGIWKSGLKILERLGLPDSFWSEAFPSNQGAIFGSRGQTLINLSYRSMADGDVTQAVTRDNLHRALISKLERVDVRFSTKIISLEQVEKVVRIVFSGGSVEDFDLVVGADGVYSKTRELVFGKKPLRSYQWLIWGGYVNRKYEYFNGWHAISGPKEFLLSFPLSTETNTFGLACHKEKFGGETISKQQNLHHFFKKLEVILPRFVNEVGEAGKLFFSELYFVKMKEWYKGRVVLIGDSRHARSPISGMGTTLALEDAYVLAEEIKGTRLVTDALQNYASRRQRRVSFVLSVIDFLEWNVMVKGAFKTLIRDILFLLVPNSLIIFTMKKVFQDKI